MAHHYIILNLKDNNVNIPYQYLVELYKLVDENINIHFEENNIQLQCNSYYWDYNYDIEEIFKNCEITKVTIEAYRWFRENTILSSDCWNVNDADFGPNSWEEMDKIIERYKRKYL